MDKFSHEEAPSGYRFSIAKKKSDKPMRERIDPLADRAMSLKTLFEKRSCIFEA